MIAGVQNAPRPDGALEVTVDRPSVLVGVSLSRLDVVTANELHVPVSDPAHPTPTFLKLLSADIVHSFWVPRLAGKTDLIPNRVNQTWIDPARTGLYLGQCAQYCGTQHAQDAAARLRAAARGVRPVDSRAQRQPAPAATRVPPTGRRIFETTACINCHTVAGTVGQRTFRSRSHAPDEPRNDCVRRAPTRPRIFGSGFRIPTPSNRDPGCRRCSSATRSSTRWPHIWRRSADARPR